MAPRKKARTRERLSVDARREQLLRLGLEAFSAQPYDEVSLDDVAQEAGISRALIFHYFPTKRDFYVETMRAAAAHYVASAVDIEGGSPYERLLLGLEVHFAYVEDRAKPYAALLRGGIGSDAEILRIVDGVRARIIDRIRIELPEAIRDTPSMRTALRGWIGFMEAITLEGIDHGDMSRDELKALAVQSLAALLGEHAARLMG